MQEDFQLPAWLWFVALFMYAAWGIGNALYGTWGSWLMTLAMVLLIVHAVANIVRGSAEGEPWFKLPYVFYAGVVLMFVSLLFS